MNARPIRVVHVARRFWPLFGGTERYVADLATAQMRRGHTAAVLTLDRDVAGIARERLPAREQLGGVSVVRVAGLGGHRIAITLRPDQVLRTLSAADVVHVHDLRFLFGIATLHALVRRVPVIVHTHGMIFHTPRAAWLKRNAVRWYFGPMMHVAQARIVASSEPDLHRLLSLAPYLGSRARLLENAIDLRALFELERRPEPGLVMALGRVAPSKQLDSLLSALHAARRGDWRLEIVGAEEAGERLRLEGLASNLGVRGRVTFRGGFTEDKLGEYLARAALAVFPSPAEGFGLALLEAMAAGVPVLASQIPAHRSVLGQDLGDRLVDFRDPTLAAARIEAELATPRATVADISRRERERARRYDVERLASQVDALYDEMGVGKRRPGPA